MHDPVDAWHDHSRDAAPQNPHAEVANAGQVIGVGVGLFMVVVLAVVVIYGYYIWETTGKLSDRERREGSAGYHAREEKAAWDAELRAYGWQAVPSVTEAEPGKRYVRLPLDKAQERVIDTYKETLND